MSEVIVVVIARESFVVAGIVLALVLSRVSRRVTMQLANLIVTPPITTTARIIPPQQ